jgi:cytochrome c biogenesis protein
VRVRLDDFRIDYHPTGQPRDFTSELDLLEPGTNRVLRHVTLSVNHPAAYGGLSLFQSGFDDGGTRVTAHVVGAPGASVQATVGGHVALALDRQPLTLEMREYHPRNVVAEAPAAPGSLVRTFLGEAGAAARTDLGRSVVAAVRDSAGQALAQTTFVDPVRIEGHPFFVSAFESPEHPTTYLRFPLDANGSLSSYEGLMAALRDPGRLDAISGGLTRRVSDRAAAAVVRDSLDSSFEHFFRGGLGAVGSDGKPLPAAGRAAVYSLMSRAALAEWSVQHPGAPVDEGLRFVADSLVACSAWIEAGRPVVVHVDGVTPRDATVLQVTSSPGRHLVYTGMFLLAIGVVLLVLPQERRAFVRQSADGAIVVGLAAHRPLPALAGELQDIVQRLASVAHVDAAPFKESP